MTEDPLLECPEWLKTLDPKFDTLRFHHRYPEIGVDEYIRTQHLALGKRVLAKRRIYLDQKYWIYCRDVVRGRPQNSLHTKIYEALRLAVESGEAICPASHVILEETLKQEDSESRNITATVIQELSTGVAIQPYTVLFQAEVVHFLTAERPWPVDVASYEQTAWTYIGNIYGHMSPVDTAFDDATEIAIRKSWFDLMAAVPFTELASSLFPCPQEVLRTPAELYDELNEQSEIHDNAFDSYQDAFLIEIAGLLDVHRDELREAQMYLFQQDRGQGSHEVSNSQIAEAGRMLENLIYHAFRMGKIERQLPGMRIMAGIHAGMRYKRQKSRRGDRHDHFHARSALPYCDLFCTEKSLSHLLCDKPLQYDELYGCQVVWRPEDVLSAIKAG